MIFFHKFYLFQIFNNTHLNIERDLVFICISCFFLTTKCTNNLIHISDILKIIYDKKILENNFQRGKEKEYNIKEEEHKKIIFDYEFLILSSVGFKINSELPSNYVSSLYENISRQIDTIAITNLKNKWITYINNSYYFPFFLKFKPLIIALSCLKILLQNLKLQINLKQLLSNHKELEFDSMEIENCSALMCSKLPTYFSINGNNLERDPVKNNY